MHRKDKLRSPEERAKVIEEAKRARAERDQGYRERALKMFPHVCAKCGREFAGKNLRELTVHHKDHNHLNNPPDGSNWELLCVYCHDNEHLDPEERAAQSSAPVTRSEESSLGFQAFEGLKNLLPDEEQGGKEDTGRG